MTRCLDENMARAASARAFDYTSVNPWFFSGNER
jgi:hypothetical protein